MNKDGQLFDYLTNILVHKNKELYELHISLENFESSWVTFMVLRYLSLNADPKVREIGFKQELNNLEPALLYKLLMKIVPKQKQGFTKYQKSSFTH